MVKQHASFLHETIPRLDAPPRGETALHAACRGGHAEIVQVLLDAGAHLDPLDANNGDTPLTVAALRGHTEVVRVLVQAGAQVNAVSLRNGYTPLHAAACYGHTAVVQELLQQGDGGTNGASIMKLLSRKNRCHRTALDLAHWCRKDAVVDLILQHYAQLLYDTHGAWSLHALLLCDATFPDHGHSDDVVLPIGTLKSDHAQTLLKYLTAKDAELVHCTDEKTGLLPLHMACRTGAPFHVFLFLLRRFPPALLSLYALQQQPPPPPPAAGVHHNEKDDS